MRHHSAGIAEFASSIMLLAVAAFGLWLFLSAFGGR
jgi:hypothetical protein